MSAPLMPSPLDYIGRRRFSFYPPIKHIEPNEWLLGTGSWTEVQIVNAQTGAEIWISRQYIGGVSDTQGSYLVVGLTKELECKAGLLRPRVKRVIEMPHTAGQTPERDKDQPERPPGPAPVIGIRLEEPPESSANKVVTGALIAAMAIILLSALLSAFFRR